MLCKCSGKYIDIYFNLKITFLFVLGLSWPSCFLHCPALPSSACCLLLVIVGPASLLWGWLCSLGASLSWVLSVCLQFSALVVGSVFLPSRLPPSACLGRPASPSSLAPQSLSVLLFHLSSAFLPWLVCRLPGFFCACLRSSSLGSLGLFFSSLCQLG